MTRFVVLDDSDYLVDTFTSLEAAKDEVQELYDQGSTEEEYKIYQLVKVGTRTTTVIWAEE